MLPLVLRIHPGVRPAHRHRAFGERSVDGMLGRGAQPDPLVAETGRQAARDHRFEDGAAGLVTHAVPEIAARPHLLQRGQIAALVMHARQAVADELLRDVGQPVAVALQPLVRGEGRPRAGLAERAPRPIRDAAVEIAVRVAIERPARRIGCVPGDARHLERLAVVVRRVTAAVVDGDRMVLRHLVEVVDVQLAPVLHLGVVEEIAVDPRARRRLARLRAELVDDAADGHELDVERIADEDLVKEDVALEVIVAIGESGDDRHLPGVEPLRARARERRHVPGAADGHEPAGLHRERVGSGSAGVDGVDPGVEDDEIDVPGVADRRGFRRGAEPRRAGETGDAGSGQTKEVPAASAVVSHRSRLPIPRIPNPQSPIPTRSRTAPNSHSRRRTSRSRRRKW